MSLSKSAQTYLLNQTKYKNFNAFTSLVDPSVLIARTDATGPSAPLSGIRDKPIAIKDNICTKDFKTTASSAILRDFTSPYDATVVKLLKDEGAVVVGKTNMDEFGMGSHSTHSHFGPVRMQRREGEDASAGGSSGGSALAVASSQCWAALGTDTGGSVRLPAAYTGVVGFKPSYGLLSRRGVIAYANSLDTVGILGRNQEFVRTMFDKLNVHDPQDPTSIPPSTRARFTALQKRKNPRPLRIGIPLDYNIDTLHPVVRKAWILRLRHLWDRGHTLHPIRLPTTQQALSAYYVLAPAEASSNLARYDGVRFGSRADGIDGTPDSVLFAKTRGQGFGPEVQRRILLGAFSLSAEAINNYFIQAQKVRRLVQQDFNNVFATPNPLFEHETISEGEQPDKVDVIICPTAPSMAPPLSEVETQDPIHSYTNDVFTVPASLAGLPAISVPVRVRLEEDSGASDDSTSFFNTVGLQIIGQYGDDQLVLDAAEIFRAISRTPQTRGGPGNTAWGDFTGESSTSSEESSDSSAESPAS
ncbi:aspartyl glutamyl-trna(asn gln) a subunit [Stemphylium lycopersici]|uniref:Glutamyl-tRNA(Gln) amidotransferase subunit A, mitochondrial n=1 Tax=Stemphylium lycopersici TaxID=183478 RepID=A0A364N3A1_STELY|nr:aspartyl glutamyl-trna(asn gln) a subunit [Stemphylium lycopersici]RAR10845.1 glutamyl-tRNA amidotransferas-like protein [Stemphylium lycopersici]